MSGYPVGPSKSSMQKREREYQAEDDCRTLERAEEVRQDKSRLQGAQRHAGKRIMQMKRVMGGRAAAKRAPRRR